MSKRQLQEKQQRERDELLDAAVFELNQKINLTIRDISDEKANALTDVLRVNFMDIVRELDALQMVRNEDEIAFQSERIRQWLNSLNRSAFVSLSFRIKHLRKIEDYLELITQDMSALIIRAYKVGILHIKDKAQQQPGLYQEMVHVIAITIELSVKNLLRGFALYLMPSVLDIRQSFDMARLGLVIARTLDQQQAAADIKRLKLAMIQHELLRRMDMFSLSVKEQHIVAERLIDFAALGDIEFSRKGEGPSRFTSGPYLISKMDAPHIKPRRSGHLSDIMPINAFLIHASEIFKKAAESVDYAAPTSSLTIDLPQLHLENTAASLSLCSSMLLRTFKKLDRLPRQNLQEAQLQVPVRQALTQPRNLFNQQDGEFKPWQVVNLSRFGVMLESNHTPFAIGTLIEIDLASSPRYALVRWCRSSLQGDVHCGVEFVASDVTPAHVILLNFASSGAKDKFWTGLLEKVPSGWNLWLGDWQGIPVPMSVSIKCDGKARTICRIMPTGEVGSNYAVFHITEVMNERKAESLQELNCAANSQDKQDSEFEH